MFNTKQIGNGIGKLTTVTFACWHMFGLSSAARESTMADDESSCITSKGGCFEMASITEGSEVKDALVAGTSHMGKKAPHKLFDSILEPSPN